MSMAWTCPDSKSGSFRRSRMSRLSPVTRRSGAPSSNPRICCPTRPSASPLKTKARKPSPGFRSPEAIAFLQYAHMMPLMPDKHPQHVRSRQPHAVGVTDPAPSIRPDPRGGRGHGVGYAQVTLQEDAPGLSVEAAIARVLVLVETRQGFGFAPRNAYDAVQENQVGVGDVSDHFLHAPLPGSVAVKGPAFGNAGEKFPARALVGGIG